MYRVLDYSPFYGGLFVESFITSIMYSCESGCHMLRKNGSVSESIYRVFDFSPFHGGFFVESFITSIISSTFLPTKSAKIPISRIFFTQPPIFTTRFQIPISRL